MKESAPGSLAERKQERAKKFPQTLTPIEKKKASIANRLQARRLEKLSLLHRLVSRLPNRPADPNRYKVITEEKHLKDISEDAAHIEGWAKRSVEFRNAGPETNAGAAEVAAVLKMFRGPLYPQGTRSSLTGGATPDGGTVLEMGHLNKILNIDRENHLVTVQPGVTLKQLEKEISGLGLHYPPGPTEPAASFGGMVATNAAGAETFKHGQTRKWVERIQVVLANGEVLDIKRGEKKADKSGFFELESADGTVRRIKIPNYKMPDVPKSSAGYYAEPEMDLIDVFIGSGGTLGVITEVTVRVIPAPTITWAVVPCKDEKQALALTTKLREASLSTRRTKDSIGLDASAIEYIDERSTADFLQKYKETGELPNDTKAVLIIQLERTQQDVANDSTSAFFDMLKGEGLEDSKTILTEKGEEIENIKAMRKAVPDGVNLRVGEYKKKEGVGTKIVKMAGDYVVPFEHLGAMLQMFREVITDKYGLEYYVWGHHSDGNEHPNIVCRTSEEVKTAKLALLECGRWVIKHGGSIAAEHGIGRSEIKQELLEEQVGKEGIAQMRALKEGFDPEGGLSPNNEFKIDTRRAWDGRRRGS